MNFKNIIAPSKIEQKRRSGNDSRDDKKMIFARHTSGMWFPKVSNDKEED